MSNNGLKGKPFNNKGRQRAAKVPRRSTLDIEILNSKEEISDTDNEENLNHIPLTAHMYRSAFVKAWCAKLKPQSVSEDPILKLMLEHTDLETPCIINLSEAPSAHTVDHWRTKIKVKGQLYKVPEVKRPGDRTVRDYHFWMYNSGHFTREDLAQMASPKNKSEDKGDSFGGSHICGGVCLNHARPESNKVNQERKAHHNKLRLRLEANDISGYIAQRVNCQHTPKCFLNPGRLGLADALIKANTEMFNQFTTAYL